MGPAPVLCAASSRRGDGVKIMQHRLLVFAKRDVSVVLKRQKVARVGGLVVNRDLGTGVMGNKGGLVSTFVVEKEGFATTCTAINAHLYVAGVPRSRTPIARVRAARIVEGPRRGSSAAAGEDQRDTERSYAPMAWRWTYKVLRSLDGVERYTTHRDKTKKNTGPPTRASSTSAWTPSRRS